MPFTKKRSSGLDFSDGNVPALEQHPDMANIALGGNQPSHLQRNKTERRRLQGLQRTNTTASAKVTPYKPNTWREKWDLWMINEGGRRLFFFVWIFLHLLVAVFGAFHYQLKDNLTTARSLFGGTFSTPLTRFFCCLPLIGPQPLLVPRPWSSTSMSSSSCSPSAGTSSRSFAARR